MRFTSLFVFGLILSGHAWSTPSEALTALETGLQVQEELLRLAEERACRADEANLHECQRPLSALERERLKTMLVALEAWRVKTFTQLIPRMDELKALPVKLVPGSRFEKKLIRQTWHITYSPDDPRAQEWLLNTRAITALQLLTFDGFFRLADALQDTPRLRSAIEYDLPAEGPLLARTYQLVMDERLWDLTRSQVLALMAAERLRENQERSSTEMQLNQYLTQSYTQGRMLADDESYHLRQVLKLGRQLQATRFTQKLQRLVARLSQIFGNTVGRIQTRDGKLKRLATDTQWMKATKQTLKPLDILFEKTPMRLTDRFIPGFYGHVALWLGDPQEWGAWSVHHQGELIPLLSHPLVLTQLVQLSAGRQVLEALRLPGVTLNTLEHFMDIDDLLVIRQQGLVPEEKAQMILKALEQYGRPYDFNFDVETERALVCSEVIYGVFTQEEWPTERSFGRYTISPDQVASKVFEGRFQPVMLYHDGKKLTEDLTEKLQELLECPGSLVLFH